MSSEDMSLRRGGRETQAQGGDDSTGLCLRLQPPPAASSGAENGPSGVSQAKAGEGARPLYPVSASN